MSKIAQIILSGLTNKLVGKLTDRLLDPPIKSRTPRKNSTKTSRSKESSHLDDQLDELAAVFKSLSQIKLQKRK